MELLVDFLLLGRGSVRLGRVHAPWLGWILLLLLGEGRGVAALPKG